jgi:alpha-D-xyloside xylohydrolase
MRHAFLVLSALLLTASCSSDDAPDEPVDPCNLPTPEIATPPLHTPRWAFEPWASKDISTADDMRAFVQGFRDHDIPVGVIVLDSPWETNYNSFVPNPTRYPGFADFVKEMHSGGVRVVLWITPFINETSYDFEPGGDSYDGPSPNYDEAARCGFFVNDGSVYSWWKGKGASIDFLNQKAMAWWHRQQDPLFDVGVDGFKLDFGEEYVTSDPIATAAGDVPKQEYSEAYYRDFFGYGVHRRGAEDFVTMVRPYDRSYGYPGRFYARKENAPVAWVGDNRRDWVGLVDALDELFRSAAAGYIVIGSDIGGYLDRDDENLLSPVIPFDTKVFARWTAVGALTPFMQLHGRANIAPWTVPDHVDETVTLYRYWATLHHELVPFFQSLADLGKPILRPLGDEASWPDDYRFEIGDAFLVAPILDAGDSRDVELPANDRWLDFWDLAGDWLDGGQILGAVDVSDRAKIPLYVRQGAIVPLEVSSPVTGFGNTTRSGKLTLLLFPGPQSSSFSLLESDGTTTSIELSSGSLALARRTKPVVARIRLDAAPTTITGLQPQSDLAALDAAGSGWFYDAALRALFVELEASDAPITLSF